jgi:hypothetical protein
METSFFLASKVLEPIEQSKHILIRRSYLLVCTEIIHRRIRIYAWRRKEVDRFAVTCDCERASACMHSNGIKSVYTASRACTRT